MRFQGEILNYLFSILSLYYFKLKSGRLDMQYLLQQESTCKFSES